MRRGPSTASGPEVAVLSNIPLRVRVTSSRPGMNLAPLSPRAVTSLRALGPGSPPDLGDIGQNVPQHSAGVIYAEFRDL